MVRIITWVDLQGRYRVTSPAYSDLNRAHGFTEDQAIEWTWTKLVTQGGYRITANHPHHLVENADQRDRLAECCETYFRYVGKPTAEGNRSAIGGAWEMDTDGRPKVNMVKAIGIQMDYIRQARNLELIKLDVPYIRALEKGDVAEQQRIAGLKQTLRDIPTTFSLTSFPTPEELKNAWPTELPAR